MAKKKATPKASVRSEPVHDHEADYAALLKSVKDRFAEVSKRPLFETDAGDFNLNGLYLSNIPQEGGERAVHNCSACRNFLHRFGGLVVIGEEGNIESAVWEPATVPPFYLDAVASLKFRVESSPIKGPFYTSEAVLGTPTTGMWSHFSVVAHSIFRSPLLTARQKMAEKRESFRTLERALGEFDPKKIKLVLDILEGGYLDRSEKFVAPIRWLYDLQSRYLATKNRRLRSNFVWAALSVAPEGYLHPRASVTGSLIEDIERGLSVEEARKRFNAKVGGLDYQRPKAAPTAGNIEAAEKIAERLGIARSLERRFARIEEVPKLWEPKAKETKKEGGIFSHLSKSEEPTVASIGSVPITWEKFAREVLPKTETISVLIPNARCNFIGMTTALYPDAPPLIRWDREEERNPFSWYVYNSGSRPQYWNLSPGWASVSAVVALPNLWGNSPQPQHGEGAILVIDGARDVVKREGSGNVIFPEHVRSELHPVRSTIEAFSSKATLHGAKEATACGIDLRKQRQSAINLVIAVRIGDLRVTYRLDRWD